MPVLHLDDGELSIDAILRSFREIVQTLAAATRFDFKGQLAAVGFSRECLRGHNWSDLNLENEDLTDLDFSDCDMRGVRFAGADLRGARFVGASLDPGALANARNAHFAVLVDDPTSTNAAAPSAADGEQDISSFDQLLSEIRDN